MQLVRNFWQSQIGKKVIMAVTGLIGVGFVLGHMVGNLQMFQSPEKMNGYAYFLHNTVGGALWLVRLVLLAAVILHVAAAVQLTRQKQAARARAYEKWEPQISTFASRSIRWGGALLLVWLIYHILHFTVRPQFTSPGYSETDVYGNVIRGFSNPLIVAFYVVAMGALALHLFHGAWSSFRTLGLNQPKPRPTARSVATLVAAIVTLGFVAVPLGVFFGAIDPNPAPAPAAAETAVSTTATAQGK